VRRFTVYRRGIQPGEKFSPDAYNDPSKPQCEGVVFSDGRCAVRWLTRFRSVSVWDSYDEFHAVHIWQHPDYGTQITWHDGDAQEGG
jgi:hypothetical protein